MNNENDCGHYVEGDAMHDAVDCVSREEVVPAKNKVKTSNALNIQISDVLLNIDSYRESRNSRNS